MGTEVLRPQDVFYDRFRLSSPAFHRRKTYSNYGNGFGNPRPNNTNTNNHHNSGYKKLAPRPERQVLHRKRRSSSAPPPPPPHQPQEPEFQLLPRRSSSAAELQNNPARVTILRRGQSLDTIDATRMKRDLNSEAIGGLMRKKFMDEDDVYAGSAFFASPSPSSLPLPSFFNNNNNNHISINKDEFHHSATRDLRRLLRLE